jgi:hypothetical protein
MTCHTLGHELGREQPRTTKELLDIATSHASSKEVMGADIILGNAKTTASGGWVVPTKATDNIARKRTKGGMKGQKRQHGQPAGHHLAPNRPLQVGGCLIQSYRYPLHGESRHTTHILDCSTCKGSDLVVVA